MISTLCCSHGVQLEARRTSPQVKNKANILQSLVSEFTAALMAIKTMPDHVPSDKLWLDDATSLSSAAKLLYAKRTSVYMCHSFPHKLPVDAESATEPIYETALACVPYHFVG